VLEIGKGKVVQAKFEKRLDEIGEMTQAITSLMEGINTKSEFTLQIGKGNYQEDFKLISDEDVMGKALLEMRENLKRNAEEERKRNWATQGLAEIGTILRAQTASTEELYVNIIRFSVKYTNSNQGGLFLLDSEDKTNGHLKLVACYAYEKRKYLDKNIQVGEGLIGQCVLEKQTVYMVDIPQSYIRITSGLGNSNPASLLIVPLKVNDEVHGVMELASFSTFEKYEIEFVERLAENIAAAISTVQGNEHTKLLLQSTQQQTEEMKSQEEEMRQNMEELNATQEEMTRKEREYLARIQLLESQALNLQKI
jgi:putative methionine-R-sulfoxide reductase with GAF domain